MLYFIVMIHWFVSVQIVLSLGYVGYLVYQYALGSVGWFVKISVYSTWLLCFGTIVLLPYDIDDCSPESKSLMEGVWKLIYGLIFFLTWVLLPIAQEYETAGEFSIKQKLKRALINNLIIYGIFALIGVAFLGYLIISGKVDIAKLPPVLLAASNAFGMFLMVIFLSYGLVAIPKTLWRARNYQIKLKQHQFHAATITKEKQTLTAQLQSKIQSILHFNNQKGPTSETQQILKIIPGSMLEKSELTQPNTSSINVVKVHKQIKELTLALSRLETRWEELRIQAFKIEDIILYMNAYNQRIQSILFPRYKSEFLNHAQWIWNCQLKLVLSTVFSIVFGVVAVAIVVAELASFIPELMFINPFIHITQIESFFGMDAILLMLMAYMSFCVYTALFKLKLSSFYGLYWNKQTDAASLIFFSINCSRVSNALCYNFLQMLSHKSTSFLKVMGETNLGALFGNAENSIFAILLVLLMMFNAFDVYTRACKSFGLNRFQFESEFNDQKIDEGRKLLQKARTDLQIKILNRNSQTWHEVHKSQVLAYLSELAKPEPMDEETEFFI